MSEGKSSCVHAPASGKARRPTVESLTTGTNRLSVVEDRSLCQSVYFEQTWRTEQEEEEEDEEARVIESIHRVDRQNQLPPCSYSTD